MQRETRMEENEAFLRQLGLGKITLSVPGDQCSKCDGNDTSDEEIDEEEIDNSENHTFIPFQANVNGDTLPVSRVQAVCYEIAESWGTCMGFVELTCSQTDEKVRIVVCAAVYKGELHDILVDTLARETFELDSSKMVTKALCQPQTPLDRDTPVNVHHVETQVTRLLDILDGTIEGSPLMTPGMMFTTHVDNCLEFIRRTNIRAQRQYRPSKELETLAPVVGSKTIIKLAVCHRAVSQREGSGLPNVDKVCCEPCAVALADYVYDTPRAALVGNKGAIAVDVVSLWRNIGVTHFDTKTTRDAMYNLGYARCNGNGACPTDCHGGEDHATTSFTLPTGRAHKASSLETKLRTQHNVLMRTRDHSAAECVREEEGSTPREVMRQHRTRIHTKAAAATTEEEEEIDLLEPVDEEEVVDLERFKSTQNKTGYMGVTYDQKNTNYKAVIYVGDSYQHLGVFETVEEAAQAHARAYVRKHGGPPHTELESTEEEVDLLLRGAGRANPCELVRPHRILLLGEGPAEVDDPLGRL